MRLIDADYAIKQMQNILPVEDDGSYAAAMKAVVYAILKSESITPTIKSCWISTKDRLPSCYKVCFITLKAPGVPPQVMEAYLDYDGTWWHGNVSLINKCVTHWMPLPEPPKEVNRDADKR